MHSLALSLKSPLGHTQPVSRGDEQPTPLAAWTAQLMMQGSTVEGSIARWRGVAATRVRAVRARANFMMVVGFALVWVGLGWVLRYCWSAA